MARGCRERRRKTAAGDLADRADRSSSDGDLDQAHILARAAVELDRPKRSPDMARPCVSADPAKLRATHALGDVTVVDAAMRDLNAAMSRAL